LEKKYFLHDDWQFTLSKDNVNINKVDNKVRQGKWFHAAVPGTIHTDLLNLKLIDEPFYSDNEKDLQWIGESDWTYRTKFDFPKNFNINRPAFLVFEGVDTSAKILLNGEEIGSVYNMFLTYKFNVSKIIRDKKNKLELFFTSPIKYARQLENEKGKLPVVLNTERVYIRKAQYSFGWDWGPSFAAMGIWRNVYLLQQEEYFIENFSFDTLRIEEDHALVRMRIKLNQPAAEEINYKINFNNNNEKLELEKPAVKYALETIVEFHVKNPLLWWPNGIGEQNLYDLKIQVIRNSSIIDEKAKKVGIRTIQLKLKENEKNTFRFIINNKPVFLKGVNWIPADSFLPRVNESKYRKLLTLAKEANMNVVRVWGGGFYENDIFYDLCDELGLLVWHDFMFACASYPEYEEFLNNVKIEVEQNVLRLQHHPSLAIWCGNNENEWGFYQDQKKPFTEMSGYKIYHEIIPAILKQTDPNRPYWPSTPFSNEEEDPNSPLSGNRHQWGIWSSWIDYKEVKNDESLFVTEFGFQSSACYPTISKILPKDQKSSQSRLFEYHNKQIEGTERLFKFLSAHLPVRTDLRDFIYLTQLNQGLALKECVEHWQYRFPKTNGSIIWQLNDCWPVASWALIDSDLLPKLSYYLVKNAFSKNLIISRKENNNIKIFVINNSMENFAGRFQIDLVELPSGNISKIISKKVIVDPSSKNECHSFNLPKPIEDGKGIYVISLFDKEDNLVNRNLFAGTEFKYMKMPRPRLKIKLYKSKKLVKISTDKPAFFVFLEVKGLLFRDNSFTILPDEKITLPFSGSIIDSKKGTEIFCTTLNQYLV